MGMSFAVASRGNWSANHFTTEHSDNICRYILSRPYVIHSWTWNQKCQQEQLEELARVRNEALYMEETVEKFEQMLREVEELREQETNTQEERITLWEQAEDKLALTSVFWEQLEECLAISPVAQDEGWFVEYSGDDEIVSNAVQEGNTAAEDSATGENSTAGEATQQERQRSRRGNAAGEATQQERQRSRRGNAAGEAT
jgi:hypothetical protein